MNAGEPSTHWFIWCGQVRLIYANWLNYNRLLLLESQLRQSTRRGLARCQEWCDAHWEGRAAVQGVASRAARRTLATGMGKLLAKRELYVKYRILSHVT